MVKIISIFLLLLFVLNVKIDCEETTVEQNITDSNLFDYDIELTTPFVDIDEESNLSSDYGVTDTTDLLNATLTTFTDIWLTTIESNDSLITASSTILDTGSSSSIPEDTTLQDKIYTNNIVNKTNHYDINTNSTETVVVVENFIFNTTHANQLALSLETTTATKEIDSTTVPSTYTTTEVPTYVTKIITTPISILMENVEDYEFTNCPFGTCMCNSTTITCLNYDLLPKRTKSTIGIDYSIEKINIFNIANFYEIPAGYFTSIYVDTLRISNNKRLTRLLENSFTGISDIKRLFLNKNALKQLHHRTFEPLYRLNIEELSLELNSIDSFHYLMKFPMNLKILNLAGNQIKNIDKSIFYGLEKLKYLSLRGNLLKLIQANQFQSLISVEIIDLRDMYIENIDISAFSVCDKLKVLRIDNNQLKNMNKDRLDFILSTLYNLEYLSLSKNRLNKIPKVNINLKKLDLSQNSIEFIDTNNLPVSLEELSLSHNYIRIIENNKLLNFKNLHSLNLEFNKISTLETNAFYNLFNLKYLNLKGNYLKQLPSEQIYNLINLSNLDLSYQDYPGEKPNFINDFSFDRNQSLAKEYGIETLSYKIINLSGNPVTYFGKRAFCSLNDENRWIPIETLDLYETNVLNLNPCILKQLLGKRKISPKINFNLFSLKDFKTRQTTINLNCDCTTFKYLDKNDIQLNGSCISPNGFIYSINKYNCSNHDNDDKLCVNIDEYDCEKEYETQNVKKYWYSGNDIKQKSNETFLFQAEKLRYLSHTKNTGTNFFYKKFFTLVASLLILII